MAQMQPGQTFSPNQEPEEPTPSNTQVEQPNPNVEQAQPQPTIPPPAPPVAQPEETPPPAVNWPTKEEQAQDYPDTKLDDQYAEERFASDSLEVEWSASEFIDHKKGGEWYLAIFLGGGILTGLLYLITRELISVVVILLAVSLFAISGSKKPRTLNYQITTSGIFVGNKHFPFSDIKSFTVMDNGPISSISLWPLKRFMPTLNIYYPPDQEEQIFQALANHLPHEQKRHELVDSLMKRLRF